MEKFKKGLPTSVSADEKQEFADYCVELYKSGTWTQETLSEYYAEDFDLYSVDDFAALDKNTRKGLRDVLRQKGVFVKMGRNILMVEALYKSMKEEVPWPQNDSERPNLCPDTFNIQNVRKETCDGPKQREIRNLNTRRGSHTSLTNLFKAYHSDINRYIGGIKDNSDRKYFIFQERCDQIGVFSDERRKAFSIMLCGNAWQFYFDFLRNKGLPLNELESTTKERFPTAERIRVLLRDWNDMNFSAILSQNEGSSMNECLDLMVAKLREIQIYSQKSTRMIPY